MNNADAAMLTNRYIPGEKGRRGRREQRRVSTGFVALGRAPGGRPRARPVGPWANGRRRGVPEVPLCRSVGPGRRFWAFGSPGARRMGYTGRKAWAFGRKPASATSAFRRSFFGGGALEKSHWR